MCACINYTDSLITRNTLDRQRGSVAGKTGNRDRWKRTRNTTDTTGVLSDEIP